MARLYALVPVILAVGCVRTVAPRVLPPIEIVKTIEVRVPVLTPIVPPEDLTAPLDVAAVDLPTFVSPSDPNASSALTADGEMRLQWVIEYLLYRLAVWQLWAQALR